MVFSACSIPAFKDLKAIYIFFNPWRRSRHPVLPYVCVEAHVFVTVQRFWQRVHRPVWPVSSRHLKWKLWHHWVCHSSVRFAGPLKGSVCCPTYFFSERDGWGHAPLPWNLQKLLLGMAMLGFLQSHGKLSTIPLFWDTDSPPKHVGGLRLWASSLQLWVMR